MFLAIINSKGFLGHSNTLWLILIKFNITPTERISQHHDDTAKRKKIDA